MHNHYSDMKLWIVNTFLISVTFTSIEDYLKILSLCLAIGYTIRRWYLMEKTNRKRNDNDKTSNS